MITTIITIMALSYLFINAEPIILIKRILGFKEEKYDEFTPLKRFFHKLIYCWMCSAFWIGVFVCIYLGYEPYNILSISACSSFFASLIEKGL